MIVLTGVNSILKMKLGVLENSFRNKCINYIGQEAVNPEFSENHYFKKYNTLNITIRKYTRSEGKLSASHSNGTDAYSFVSRVYKKQKSC